MAIVKLQKARKMWLSKLVISLEKKGSLTSREVMEITGLSKTCALQRMKLLSKIAPEEYELKKDGASYLLTKKGPINESVTEDVHEKIIELEDWISDVEQDVLFLAEKIKNLEKNIEKNPFHAREEPISEEKKREIKETVLDLLERDRVVGSLGIAKKFGISNAQAKEILREIAENNESLVVTEKGYLLDLS